MERRVGGNGVDKGRGARGACSPCRWRPKGARRGMDMASWCDTSKARSLQEEEDVSWVIQYGSRNIPVLAPGGSGFRSG